MATKQPNPDEKNESKPRIGEIGRTGTVNTGGYIQTVETNPNIAWPLSLEVYDQMRRTDSSIKGMLGLLAMPIRSAEWSTEAASDEDDAHDHAEFGNACMESVHGGWDDFIRRCLSYLAMGFYVGEKVWELCDIEYAGKKRPSFVISRVEDRLQRSIVKWHDNDGKGPLETIEQLVYAVGSETNNPMLPRDKCVLLVNEQEGADYFGNSLLRAAYGPYEYKRELELFEALAVQRSIGIPLVYSPDNVDDGVLDDLEEQLKKMNQGENLYMILPGRKQMTGQISGEGWLVETLDVQGDGGSGKTDAAIQRHEASIVRIVMAEFMRLGHNSTGARATSETQSEPYRAAIKAVVHYLEDVLTREWLAPIIKMNFGDVPVPRVRAEGLDKVDIAVFSDAFQKFVAASGITVTSRDESHLRSMMGLPEVDEAERERVKADKIAQAQAAFKPDPGAEPDTKKDDKPAPLQPEKLSAPRTLPFTPSRELRPEETFVAFDAIDRQIDARRLEFAASGGYEADAIARDYAAHGSYDTEALENVLYLELVTATSFGADQVSKELERQKIHNRATFEAPRVTLPGPLLEQLRRRAKLAGESVAAAIKIAVDRAKIDQLRRRGENASAVFDAGTAAGGVALRREAIENVTAALNLGRDAQAKHQGATIATYSSLLDSGTCAPCANDDGTETVVGSSEYDALLPPNAQCSGSNACRCIQVYTGDESI